MNTHPAPATRGSFLIGKEEVRGSHGDFRARNPRTGEELEPLYGLGGIEDVDRAVKLAAHADAIFRDSGAQERASFLERIASEIEAVREPILDRVEAETGIARSQVEGEFARTTNQLRLFANVVREGSWRGIRVDPAKPEREPLPRPDLRQRKIALGPVAVFSSSNFPLSFSVAGGDTASAFAAGCPVVVKAHSAHPGSSELVGRAVRAAVRACGLPEGTFSMLFGSGKGLGAALVAHPGIKAVGFTGSRSGGLALLDIAARRPVPIPVYAEMSSVNPVFILPDALAHNAGGLGQAFITSVNTRAGQLCTSPGLIFAIEGDDLDSFIRAAGEAVQGSQGVPMLNSGISSNFDVAVERFVSAKGLTRVAAGASDDAIAVCGVTRLFATDGATFLANPALSDEAFGAAALVVRARDFDQMAEIARGLEGQLTATVHATPEDHGQARILLPILELLAGRIIFNGWPTGVEVGHAVIHGGPFPATSAPATTSVGSLSIERFLRPVSYQNAPADLLPTELRDENFAGVWRRVDGEFGQD
jgi:NADP-dependent aldehyde dehydrogenase